MAFPLRLSVSYFFPKISGNPCTCVTPAFTFRSWDTRGKRFMARVAALKKIRIPQMGSAPERQGALPWGNGAPRRVPSPDRKVDHGSDIGSLDAGLRRRLAACSSHRCFRKPGRDPRFPLWDFFPGFRHRFHSSSLERIENLIPSGK